MFQAESILQQHYQLQQRLGRTAAGHQTWLAIDLQSNERVTVKLLAFSPEISWDELKLFEREAQILQAIDRPRIPRYRDYFDLDKTVGGGVPWFALVQEYIPGDSLQELLDSGKRFSESEIRSIATEVLEILIYLHELSPPVLHRDIKPSNLILGEDKHIYLIDFGAVQAQAAVTGVTFTIVGTSGYAPLEQFWGRAVPASDLYALGATLIHLLTRIAPADLPIKDSRIQFCDRVSIQSNLIGWIERATEITVEKRFGNAREALDSLRFQSSKSLAKSQNITPQHLNLLENRLSKRQQANGVIEIYIPAIGFQRWLKSNSLIPAIFLCVYTSLVFIPVILLNIDFIFLVIFFCCLFLVSTGMLTSAVILLDSNKIIFKRQFSNLKPTSSRSPDLMTFDRQSILGIFAHKKGKLYRIIFHVGNKTRIVANNLNGHEAAWLIQELRDWLDIETQENLSD